MKDGLPVLEAEPGFMEAMARKAAEMQAKTNPDPLACQVDVNTLIANYEAIIGQLTGQLTSRTPERLWRDSSSALRN
jgi:hypothetical protein